MRLTSPHNILTAYSRGELGKHQAMSMLGLVSQIELIAAMSDVEHPLPRPEAADIEAQVAAALPSLKSALIAGHGDA